jgi:hypothetical protein
VNAARGKRGETSFNRTWGCVYARDTFRQRDLRPGPM